MIKTYGFDCRLREAFIVSNVFELCLGYNIRSMIVRSFRP